MSCRSLFEIIFLTILGFTNIDYNRRTHTSEKPVTISGNDK